MSFPRYPKYKASGVEWLGEIPARWEVDRLKHVCHAFPSNVDKKSQEGEASVLLCNYTDVYYNEVIVAGMNFMTATATADQISKFTLRRGDTIITKDSETAEDIAVSAFVPRDLPRVVCGYHLSLLRPVGGTDGAFVKRLFDSSYAKACVAIRANGLTRVGLGQYELDNIEVPVPPPHEQSAIAAFLDRETTKIDGLVAEQRRLTQLLREKRQAVISRAVTKGLNPDVPMKPSGIEWLGDVPAHWQIARLGYYSRVENGSTPSRDRPDYWDEGDIPWVASGEVNQERITQASDLITQSAVDACSLRLLPRGSIVIGMVGQGKTRGMAASLEIEAAINQNLGAIVLSAALESDYVLYLFQAMYEYLRELGRGGNQAALNCEILAALLIPLPPVGEQRQIAEVVRIRSTTFEALMTEAHRAIELLQERRTALISAAVTGQIDVRGLVPSEVV